MEGLGEFWRRFLFLLRGGRFNREMEEELRFHLERKTEQNRDDGMSAEEAAYAARRRFGNAALLKEKSREAWGWSAVDHLLQDVKFAVRSLSRNPVFTAIVILTLAFGIGVNTAIFSAVHALLLNPYPFPQADRIVSVEARHISGKNDNTGYQDFLDWQRQNAVFESMAITPWTGEYTLTGQGEPQRIAGGGTTADFLRVLGIQPALGRFFTAEEDQPGAPRVAVLTYESWRQRLNADPGVLGRAMTVDGTQLTIVGVLPPGFVFPGIEACDFFAPLHGPSSLGRTQHQYGVVARLKPGITVAQAQSDMSTIAHRLELEYPATNTGWGVRVQPLSDALAEQVRTPVEIFFCTVGFVLLLACVNVSGLMLARASGRAKEIAIRSSLGAGRGRIVRQILTETVLLSVSGGAAGILLALWLMDVLRRAAPQQLALDAALRLNPAVLLFTLLVSLFTGIVSGFVPAWSASGGEPSSTLKNDGNAWSRSRSRNRLMSSLVAGEVALSVMLLAGAGLLVKSFITALRVETGLRVDHLLTFRLALPQAKYSSAPQAAMFYRNLVDRLNSSPGVEASSGVSTLPMTGGMQGGAFEVQGRPKAADWVDTSVQYSRSTPGYFRTMGIPVLRGRDFDERDTEASLPVGIVNDTLARRFFPGQDPIGQRYKDAYDGKWRTIVGVVGSVKSQQPMNPPVPGLFCPHAQSPSNWMWITLRARGDEADLTGMARAAVHSLDPDLPLLKIRTMQEVVSDSLSGTRLLMQFLAGFAIFALLLDAIGIYGIVDYSVRQRTHEMGIRVALGASYGNVVELVLRRGAIPAAAGVLLGLPVALAASGLLRAMLYGISPRDLTVFLGVPVVLLLVALGASILPARRAARVDPVIALRCE
jgi:putative ABC transport system permease protein